MHNQTEPAWLIQATPDSLGTGLFLRRLGPPGVADYQVTPELQVTYPAAVVAGQTALAFKWVPHHVASEDLVLKQMGSCGALCARTCVRYGCVCNPETGRCE
jgi:hypothetical protein